MQSKSDPIPEHRCPICGASLPHMPRYPRYVCPDCAKRAADDRGRPVVFFNQSLSGGFGGQVAKTAEPYNAHECFIDGIPCWADEAHFGGIVVEVL